jgi:hypothetical protein
MFGHVVFLRQAILDCVLDAPFPYGGARRVGMIGPILR